MVKSSKDVGFLLIGGRSVLGAPLTNIGEEREHLLEEITGLGDAFDSWKPVGQRVFTLTQEGFYNDVTDGFHDALVAADPQVLMYAPVGNTFGADLVAFSGVRTSYAKLPARGTLHKAKATYRANAGPEAMGRTLISAILVARATAGPTDTTSDDQDMINTNGGAIYLGVNALTLGGYTSVTIAIRHSDDDLTFVDLGTFTVVTTAPTAERKVITGTINNFILTRHTFNGAGSGQSITFVTGIGRN